MGSINGTYNVVEALRKFRELATYPNPDVKPLIVNNRYFASIVSIYQNYGLVLFYAYYGRGKTYGVGYKLYHESHPRYGIYDKEYNTIYINARMTMYPENSPIYRYILQVKGREGANLIPAIIGGILHAGLQPKICLEMKKLLKGYYNPEDKSNPFCLSTFSLYDEKLINKISNYIPNPESVSEKGWDYLEDVIRNVNRLTGKKTIILIDEIERWLTERFAVPLHKFVRDLSIKIREYHDTIGTLDFKTILLVQKAIISEAEIQSIRDKFNTDPMLSAAKGITVIDEIKHYDINVYIDYIIEALDRLYRNTREPQFDGLKNLVIENKNKIRKYLKFIESIPARIAFGIIDRFIDELTRQKIYNMQYLKSDILINAIKNLLNNLKTVGSIWKLYSIVMEKSSLITDPDVKENISKIVDYISEHAMNIDENNSTSLTSTKKSYAIKKLIEIEQFGERKRGIEFGINMKCILFRTAKSKIKDINKDANNIVKSILNDLKYEIKLLQYKEKSIPRKIIVSLYPIIYRKSQDIDGLIKLYKMIKIKLEREIKDNINNYIGENIYGAVRAPRPEIVVNLFNPLIIDDDDIIVLYMLAQQSIIETNLQDYIDNRREEIINEIKTRWKIKD